MTVVIPPDPEGGRCEQDKDEEVLRWHQLRVGMVILIQNPTMRREGLPRYWFRISKIRDDGMLNLEGEYGDGTVITSPPRILSKRHTYLVKRKSIPKLV